MTRRHVTYPCEGETLVGTLDEAAGTSGLLIVSGGNDPRAGAFSGQAQLAQRMAAAGFPVFRFDRRGIGDSSGANRGFRHSREDILASIAAFRAECPQVARIVAFGNCDAASTLMLMGGEKCDALVLSNPWTFDDDGDDDGDNAGALPSPGAIRKRYAEKLKDGAEIKRLLTGGVSLSGLLRGVKRAFSRSAPASDLATEMRDGLANATKPFVILVAGNDRTGLAFAETWDEARGSIHLCEGASHAYVEPHAIAWRDERILEMLRASG